MKDKRGQTALEFMFTYGWAILIILIITVMLWQQGLFNQGSRVRPGYSGFWGVIPYEDFRYNEGGTLTIPLSNRVGGQVTILSVNATLEDVGYDDNNPGSHMTGSNSTIPSGNIRIWEVSQATSGFAFIGAGSSYRIFISLTYNDSRTGENYISSGWVWGNVEA